MVEEDATMPEEQVLNTPVAEETERATRSEQAHCLRWSIVGAALGVVASILAYRQGSLGTSVFVLLPCAFLVFVAVVHGITIVVVGLMRRPASGGSLPMYCGIAAFAAVALLGGLGLGPRIYIKHVESLRATAVEAVERHYTLTGHYPDYPEALSGLPEGVSYSRARRHDGYTLRISDKFSLFFGGWQYDSQTKRWTDWVD